MDKTYKFDNCTVTVHIPETRNKDLNEATEKFMKEVFKERGERDER